MISLIPDFTGLISLCFDSAAKGVLLLALAFLVLACMKRRSAAAHHLILSLTLGALLLLPLLSWTLPEWSVLPRWIDTDHSGAAQVHAWTSKQSSSPESSVKTASRPKRSSPDLAFAGIPPNLFGGESVSLITPVSSLSLLILIVWLLGAFCVFAPTLAGLISLRLLRWRSQVVQSGTRWELLNRIKVEMGCRRKILLLTSPLRRMPMMWGVFPPIILLPQDSLEWTEERLQVVLLHELAHIQRNDFLTSLIARLACALHWFNPLAWMAARQIGHEQEKACDDLVLRAGAAPENYAEEVLQFATGRPIPRLDLSGAVAMARPSSLESRLLAILDGTRNRASLTRRGNWIAAILVALAVAPIAMLRAASLKPAQPEGLVAWWRGDGDGKDSASHHDGEFPFGEKYAPGVHNRGFNFLRSYSIDDQLRRVSIADSPDFEFNEAMTLEAWIFPVEYGGIVLLRGDDRAGLDAWQIDLMNTGRINFHFNSADNQGAGVSAPIQLNQLQHVTAVFDRGSIKLYVNAVLLGQAQTTLRPIRVLDKAASPAIGIGNAGGKYYSMPFNGMIDEVCIYNRALSEAEIEERMRR